MLGYAEEELLELSLTDIHPPESLAAVLAEFAALTRGEKASSADLPCRRKDGTIFYATISHGAIMLEGHPYEVGFFRDISKSREAEAEIQRQLAEKAILLKEVHHRIKNNIAAIASLLSMQAKALDDPRAAAVLQNAIGRVDSMRILYDKLLLSDDFQDMPVKNYVESLADAVVQLFSVQTKVKLDIQITDFQLDPKRLFHLGIIVNELLTNSMKYAFNDNAAGRIRISLSRGKNHMTLEIQDDGSGLPDRFDINETKGFGLQLVKMLSLQLGGRFAMESRAGTRCTLTFDV
jgi:two-component sensor histidine kinase